MSVPLMYITVSALLGGGSDARQRDLTLPSKRGSEQIFAQPGTNP